ncbi:MFS transporter [Halarchaeum sp. P4]|uniref:MFS transporter n=1 Tax=Halarchaeum sp. P4 TaxID=3421639 RepID=UPI003EBCFBBB
MDGDTERYGRGGVFVSICCFAYLVNFSRVGFAPLVDTFMDVFRVQPGTAGLVATLVWLGSALTRLPTGYLLTHVERHHAIAGTGVLLVVAASFTTLAPTITVVAAGALFIGCATGVFYIAANPLVTELYPERVGWAVGIRGGSSQLAAVSAPLLVGFVVVAFGWRGVFAGVALVGVILTAVFAFTSRRATMPSAGVQDRDLLGAVREQWHLVLTGIVVVGVTGFVWQGLFNFYIPYLGERGFDDGTARTLLTVVFAAGVPAFFLSGRLADRVRRVPLVLAIVSAFVCCLLALTVVEGLLAVAVVSAVLGYVIHSLFPTMDAFLLGSLPDDSRASAYSAYSAVMMLMQAPGSLAVGVFVEYGVGYATVFRVYALVLAGVVTVLVALYVGGRLPTDAASPGSA